MSVQAPERPQRQRWGSNEINEYNDALKERWNEIEAILSAKIIRLAQREGDAAVSVRTIVRQIVAEHDGDYSYDEVTYVLRGMMAQGQVRTPTPTNH